jgi:hypothetical protein
MADKKISQLLGATTPLAGTEVLAIVQSGETKKVAVTDLTGGLSTIPVSKGGTGLTTVEAGYVPYGNNTTTLSKSANLFFSGSNLGVGTVTPQNKIQVTADDTSNSIGASTAAINICNFSTTSFGRSSNLIFSLGGGTTADTLSAITSIYQTYNTSIGGALAFSTNNGSSSFAERMRITAAGNVGVGTSNPATLFAVSDAGAAGVEITPSGTIQSFNRSTSAYGALTFDAAALLFRPAGTEVMRVAATNNVGIGTASPNASAMLDVQSTTKGVRMPNMTTTQKNAIASPAAGLMVFDTTLAKLCVYSGSAWQTITSI